MGTNVRKLSKGDFNLSLNLRNGTGGPNYGRSRTSRKTGREPGKKRGSGSNQRDRGKTVVFVVQTRVESQRQDENEGFETGD